VLEAGTVSVAFLVAVFIANIPEAIGATTALVQAGRSMSRMAASASESEMRPLWLS
jgi:hypothetical protein